MGYRLVDMNSDPRSGQYAYFTTLASPFAGVTVQVDITDFCAGTKGKPFFLTFLYAALRALNAVPELRRRIAPDGVREYERCDASYTVMRPSGAYAYCYLEPCGYETFLAEGRRREALARETEGLQEEGDTLRYVFVSCVPWLSYTQIEPPHGGGEDSNPRLAWGKFYRRDGQVMMPVSLFVNHALVDGVHIARFYEQLEREMQQLIKQLQNER